MVEIILIAVMALSVVGMITAEMHDPLSRRFWDQWRE